MSYFDELECVWPRSMLIIDAVPSREKRKVSEYPSSEYRHVFEQSMFFHRENRCKWLQLQPLNISKLAWWQFLLSCNELWRFSQLVHH